jgi:hypothetical protein
MMKLTEKARIGWKKTHAFCYNEEVISESRETKEKIRWHPPNPIVIRNIPIVVGSIGAGGAFVKQPLERISW